MLACARLWERESRRGVRLSDLVGESDQVVAQLVPGGGRGHASGEAKGVSSVSRADSDGEIDHRPSQGYEAISSHARGPLGFDLGVKLPDGGQQAAAADGKPDYPGPMVGGSRLQLQVPAFLQVTDDPVDRLLRHHGTPGQVDRSGTLGCRVQEDAEISQAEIVVSGLAHSLVNALAGMLPGHA